ncbi:MAG TPA: ABC transporter permease [Propionibacteriaceae bacterium]|nr:ABC transporter permease [Propionibacteriaceae bacterium]
MSLHRIRLIIWKEFLQLRRDPLLLRLIFIMPIVQLIFFGYVVSADVRNLSTAVVDLDRSAISRELIAAFASSSYFTVEAYPTSETELEPLMDRGDIRVAIVIPEGTEAHVEKGEIAPVGIVVDGSDSRTAAVSSGYAAQIVARLNADRITEQGLAVEGPEIDSRVRVLFNPSLRTVNTMIPGLVAAILMLSVMAIMSQAVVRERESGTLEQMFVTPITRGEYLIGKVTPYVLLAVLQISLVALVGIFWFRVPFRGTFAEVAVGLGLFMLTVIGLGLLVSLVSHTRQQAQQTVLFIMLPMMLLSGFIFPIESMPTALVPVTYALPLTWAVLLLRGAFVKGVGFSALLPDLLILALFAVVIFGIAVMATRRRLSE